MLTQIIPVLCLLGIGVTLLILAILVSRAPRGRETARGFEREEKKP